MFTGIIEAVGEIAAVKKQVADLQLYIRTATLDLQDVSMGDSIATNGVCLTVIGLPGDGFWADVSMETLTHTNFSRIQIGAKVNLEKALQADGRFGGHIVTGHVDGLGHIVERRENGRSIVYTVQADAAIARYIAVKGSITVDGVSLTVNTVDGNVFALNIVPHTAQNTLLANYQVGHSVHLEVDIIARYMERLMQQPAAQRESTESATGLDLEKLAEFGFLK